MFEVYYPKPGRKKKPNWKNKENLLLSDLIKLARQGDSQAMDILLGRFTRFVWSKAFQLRIFFPGADIDDLKQEGMIGLYKAILGYDSTKNVSFVSHASRSIRCQIISALKYYSRQKHQMLNKAVSLAHPLSDDGKHTLADMIPSRDLDPLEITIRKETEAEVERLAAENFSKLECGVLLCRVNGMSYQKAALYLGVSQKTIDNAVCRIKKKSRHLLQRAQ